MNGRNPGGSLPGALFLAVTAFTCGGIIMVIEILGSRVIGPFFGVSLFVWTSLITVTLIALAAGYALGGMLSDRRESPDLLFGIILAAGLLVLVIPALRGPVLKFSQPLGLRAGSLLSSFLLFGPSLLLLGCVSPYIVRMAVGEMRRIGRTVGFFYAISTVGSFVGTVTTGFVLITVFGVNRIFQMVGGLLILLSVSYFVFFRRKWLALALLPLLLLPLRPEARHEVVRPSGTKVKVVFEAESFYGKVKVVDYRLGEKHTRELAIDGLVQGGVDMRSGLSVYGYPYLLERIPLALKGGGKTCLVIGLGAGVVPRWYERKGITTDVVDIDPVVVSLARRYFGFSSRGETFVEDARYFLQTTDRKYDFIVLDVFTGDTTPGHLLSLEALGQARARLAPGGVLAANLFGSLKRESYMTASIVRTLEEVFANVDLYPLFPPDGEKGYGNIVAVGYDGPPVKIDPVMLGGDPLHPFAAAQVLAAPGRKFSFPEGTEAMILTDDYNPIDFYDLWLKETVRRSVLEDTDADVLL